MSDERETSGASEIGGAAPTQAMHGDQLVPPLDFSALSAALLDECEMRIAFARAMWALTPPPRVRRTTRLYREIRWRLAHAWRALRGEECE